MEILDIPQMIDGIPNPEWMAARIGSIGGSSISSVVAGGQGKMRKNLMYRLAGEILSGQKYEGYSNSHMERGVEQEDQARAEYEFMTGIKVQQIGLIKESEHKHCSPDGITMPDPSNGFEILGIQEIKCVIPSVHVETIIMDRIPPEYVKQCQWNMFICQADWCDFISYSPLIESKPIWIKRMNRDKKLISELNEGADKFIQELLELVEKVMV